MTNSPKLQTALQLAQKGRYVFPADKNKYPIIKDCRIMNLTTDSGVIGKTAATLGIKNVHVRKKRCKEFSEELLKQFKLNYYL